MADDLDDLLNEVESKYCATGKRKTDQKSSKKTTQQHGWDSDEEGTPTSSKSNEKM